MAFCAVTDKSKENLNLLVKAKIIQNPESLKNFKDFTQGIVDFLLSKGVDIEKTITLAKGIPQAAIGFSLERENRDLLRAAGVSIDAINDVEKQFDTYEGIGKFLGIKESTNPLVVVNEEQLARDTIVAVHVAKTDVEFAGNARKVNGKLYGTRVTGIAKVGYDDKEEDNKDKPLEDSPALKHGNTVDVIAKAVFDETNPKFEDFQDLIEKEAFDSLVAHLRSVKTGLAKQGYIFRTAVTVYDNKLDVSGEIDLVAINPKGDVFILDFKTSQYRLNETNLKNDTLTYTAVGMEVGILSKWQQYATQGYIYARMLQDQLGLGYLNKVGIVGIGISYDSTAPLETNKITKVIEANVVTIPFTDVRPEFKGKPMTDVVEEYNKLKGQYIAPINEIKPRIPLPNATKRRKLDRIAVNEAVASDPELQEEMDWFKNNPIGKDTFFRIADLTSAGLLGQWATDGVTISQYASKGTVYHEGWHRFSQVFMSQEDKIKLYKSIQKDDIKFKTRDGRTLNTSTAEFLDIEEFLAEEFAKFGLNPSTYKYPTENPEPKTLFEKIMAFLKRFFGLNPRPVELFHKLYHGKLATYSPSVNNAFWGKLNSIAMNRKGEEIVSNERFPLYVRTFDFLIGKQLREYVDSSGRPNPKSFTAFKQSKKLQADVIDNLFNSDGELGRKYNSEGITQQQADEIVAIFTNKQDFMRAYLQSTSYQTLKNFALDEQVFTRSAEELQALDDVLSNYNAPAVDEDAEDNEDNSKMELMTPDANETAAFAMADDAIQDFFRTIPKIKGVVYKANGEVDHYDYELNELGFPENHKYYDVFYKAKKLLEGVYEMTEMQARMQGLNNQRLFPELAIINDYMSVFMDPSNQDPNFKRAVQNLQFVQAYMQVMGMPEVPNMQLTQNFSPIMKKQEYKKMGLLVSYRTASRNLALKIIKSWEKDFKDRRNKRFIDFESWDAQKEQVMNVPLYKTEDGKLFLNPFLDYRKLYNNNLASVTNPDAKKNGLKDFWEVMGVKFDPKAFTDRDAVIEMIQAKDILINNLVIYSQSVEYQMLRSLMDTFDKLGLDSEGLTDLEGYLSNLPSNMADVAIKEFFIGNPITAFNEKKKLETEILAGNEIVPREATTEAMRFVFEDLAAIEERFGPRVSSGAFRIEDKTKYPYYVPNQILMTTGMLNKLASTSQFGDNMFLSHLDPLQNKWMKRSYFMKRMFNHEGIRAKDSKGKDLKIIIEDIASVRFQTIDAQGRTQMVEKAPRSLLKDEKFFMDVLTMFRAGAIEIPRAETSSTMFAIRLADYGKGKNLPISLEESTVRITGHSVPEIFMSILKEYFAAEIEKRQWYKTNDPDVEGANKQPLANQFNIFEGILSKELKDKVVANLGKTTTPEEIYAIEGLEDQFREEMHKYFQKQIEEVKPLFDKLSIDQKKMLSDVAGAESEKAMVTISRAFIMNHFILSEEFYNMYFGDLYYYKNSFKRGKYVTNTGSPFYIDEARNQMLNNIQFSTMNSIFTGKKPQGKDFRTLKTGVINDVEMKSIYTDPDEASNVLFQGAIRTRLDSGALIEGTPEYDKYVATLKEGLKKYDLINIADGQGIVGLDFYRNFSIITNIWDEGKEDEYQRQKAIFRNHYDLYFKIDERGNKVRMEGDELSQARNADKKLRNKKPSAYFNPLKISYTGPLVSDGPTRPVFDKFSVRPMIPEMAIGKRDEDLMMRMVEGDIDYLKFKSGSKVYQENIFDWYEQTAKGEYNLTSFSVDEITPSELFSANLKHQLSTEGFKDQNIFGSQFRKIVFGVKYGVNAKANPRELAYFTKLEQEFQKTIDDLIMSEQIDLFSLLGIEQQRDNFVIKDMRKFITLLQNESITRGVAINNIDYLRYNPTTKNVDYPIDYAFNRQQIQDLLSGLIDERLRRLKVNGSSLIQVSSAGNETKKGNPSRYRKPTKEELQKYGTNGLHYYHTIYNKEGRPVRTSTMGVKVAMSKAYESLFDLDAPRSLGVTATTAQIEDATADGATYLAGEQGVYQGKIGYKTTVKGDVRLSEEEALNRLNQALKDPEWRRKHIDLLRLVGYRIPTQSMSFIDNMEIMEFLPRSAGAIIIAPPEAIIKSGSDFDIDKMNIIRPVIKNGKLVKPKKYKVTETGGEVVEKEDTIEYLNEKISEDVVDENELKKIKKQLDGVMKGQKIEIEELEKRQRRIRFKMLDVAIQAGIDDFAIDDIMNQIMANAKVIKPKYQRIDMSDDSDFDISIRDEDITSATQNYFKLVEDLAIADAEIQAIKEQMKEYSEERGKIDGSELAWFNRKRDYKNSRNNDMIQLLVDLMSHPYYFEHLITPSSSAMMDQLTNELMGAQANMSDTEFAQAMAETGNKLYDTSLSPREASTYMASLNAFDNLLSKRKDLGGYAIQRTFSDIFNYAKLSIAREYVVETGREKTESKLLMVPLIPPAQRGDVIKNGRILMHGDSVTGIPISKTFDEFISLTVDLANSPAYPKMNINNYNKNQVQYLLHQKVDPKVVLWFINQPILQTLFKSYEKDRNNIQGWTLKHAITKMALDKRMLDNPQPYPNSPNRRFEVYHIDEIPAVLEPDGGIMIEAEYKENRRKANKMLTRPWWYLHTENLQENDYFSIEEMDKAIRDGGTNSALQKKVLAYFASITEEADMLRKLEFAENVDTTKYATITSLVRNEVNRRQIRLSGLFDERQLDVIEKESMIAPFDYTRKAKSIYKSLFPKLYTNRTITSFTNLVTDVWGAKNIQIERISKIIENDYIEYIYKNYGTYMGQNLSEAFQGKLINLANTKDHKYFADRLNEIKGTYQELLEIPFVDRLSDDTYYPPDEEKETSYKGLDNKEMRNIFFLRNPDNPTFEKNIYTDNWRNLIHFDPEKLGLKNQYTAEQIAEISEFFHELIYFSLYQSGLTNTGNGFSDLIPYEHWAAFIMQAFEAYDRAKAENEGLEVSMLREFEVRFRQMNPKIDWGTKTRILPTLRKNGKNETEDLKFYKNYYRGKDYLVSDTELEMSRYFYIVPDDALQGGNQTWDVVNPENKSPYEPGVYVDYNGSTHILVSKLRSGLWKMFSIEDDTIVADSVNRITTLSDRGAVVLYGVKTYIVTKYEEIIDADSLKKLNLSTTDGRRKEILRLAKEQQKPKEPPAGAIGPEGGVQIDPDCPF